MTTDTINYTGRAATVSFALAVLSEVNEAPLTEEQKAILAQDPRRTPPSPDHDQDDAWEPTCSYCC
jgi:hypothetical protein